MDDDKELLALEEAIKRLPPDGDMVHTFRQEGPCLIGADHERDRLIEAKRRAPTAQPLAVRVERRVRCAVATEKGNCMTFDEWFSSKQGEAFSSMYGFAKAAWEDQQKRIDEAGQTETIALANAAGLCRWKEKILKAAEETFAGDDAPRFKLCLRKNGTASNVFPKELDGAWVAFQRAEDDAHIGMLALFEMQGGAD